MDSRRQAQIIEPNILKTSKLGGYRVKFTLKDCKVDEQFETLEEARAFRDKINALREQKALENIKVQLDYKEYPDNLIKALGFDDIFDIYEYFETRYEVVKQRLTDREEKIIDLLYKEHQTLQETGKEFGVSRDRIRQIAFKALKKIKHYTRYFEIGEYVNKAELAKKEYEEYLKNKKYNWDYESAKKFVADYEEEHKKEVAINGEVRIDYLDLSVRSSNCLKRAGIKTIKELLEYIGDNPFDKLIRIRNMGRKSMGEIIKSLIAHDLLDEPQKWDEVG